MYGFEMIDECFFPNQGYWEGRKILAVQYLYVCNYKMCNTSSTTACCPVAAFLPASQTEQFGCD